MVKEALQGVVASDEATSTGRRSPYLSRAPRCALDRRHIADSAYSTFRRCAGAARPSAFSTSATTDL